MLGRITVKKPTNSFSTSLMIAFILFLAAVFRNMVISKTQAEATDGIIRKGIKILQIDVMGLVRDRHVNAKGTRM